MDFPPIEPWSGRVDIVHGTNFVVPPSRRAARLITIHDLTPVRFPELCSPTSRRYPDLIRRAIRRGASVHAVSQTIANETMDYFQIAPDRVHVIHNGFSPVPQPAAGRQEGPPYILAMGTSEPRKGFTILLEAFDLIADAVPDIHLKIAGPAGWGEDALHRAIGASPNRERIHRIGWANDIGTLVAGARLFAYPSLYEGFGFPPLEAMSLNIPVVATTGGALPEILGDAAVLVAPSDVSALAAALQSVCEDDALRQRLKAKGALHVAQFTWERAGRELAELYARLI
jgi:glycosyltransferase involved in cell wall biosynthesis